MCRMKRTKRTVTYKLLIAVVFVVLVGAFIPSSHTITYAKKNSGTLYQTRDLQARVVGTELNGATVVASKDNYLFVTNTKGDN
jgi:hypothetical protein